MFVFVCVKFFQAHYVNITAIAAVLILDVWVVLFDIFLILLLECHKTLYTSTHYRVVLKMELSYLCGTSFVNKHT